MYLLKIACRNGNTTTQFEAVALSISSLCIGPRILPLLSIGFGMQIFYIVIEIASRVETNNEST